MPSLIDYRGLQVLDEASGAGGLAILNDFKSLVDWNPKSEWSQSSPPSTSQDETDDFYPGSMWLQTNVSPPQLFVCQSNTEDAAVWKSILLALSQDAAPTLVGYLDLDGHAIVDASSIDLTIGSTTVASVTDLGIEIQGCILIGVTSIPSGATFNTVFGGGATSPVLGAATTDVVSVAGVDAAAGDRRLAIQSEAGSPISLGHDQLNFAGTSPSISVGGTPVLALSSTLATVPSLSVTGATTLGDASGDQISFIASTWTCPNSVTWTRTAGSGSSEEVIRWMVSDANSYVRLVNGTSNASEFAPMFESVIAFGESGSASTPLTFSGTKGSSGTNPAVLFLGRQNTGSGNTDIPDDDPLTEFRNRVITYWQMQIMGDGSIKRNRTSDRETREYQANVSTSNNTPTTLKTVEITSAYTYLIEATVVARSSSNDGASYQRKATYTTKSGTVTLLGSVQTVGTDAEDQSAWDVTYSISGSNVLIQVTGASGATVGWYGDIKVTRIKA